MQQLVFSVSTFADAHCKSHNLLLSWRRYMNCVHSELKFLVTGSSEISSALIRTHGTYLRFSLALIRTHTTGAKPPKTGPHSCRTHVFSSLSCKSHSSALMAALWRFRRTHPHSSALIRTHPHDPCAYASTHLPHLRVSGCLAEISVPLGCASPCHLYPIIIQIGDFHTWAKTI